MNAVMENILTRRSTRAFEKKPIPTEEFLLSPVPASRKPGNGLSHRNLADQHGSTHFSVSNLLGLFYISSLPCTPEYR